MSDSAITRRIELALCGCAILNSEAFEVARSEGIRAEMLSEPDAVALWESIELVAESGARTDDEVVLLAALTKHGCRHGEGPQGLIVEAAQCCSAANNVQAYAISVIGEWRRRTLAGALKRAQAELKNGFSAVVAYSQVAAGAESIMADRSGGAETIRDMTRRGVGMGTTAVVSWQYASIDKHTGGIPCGALTVIGAYPSTGKTSVATCVLTRLAAARVPCVLFSCEMTKTQILHTLIARQTGVPVGALRAHGISGVREFGSEDFQRAVGELNELCFYVDEAMASSVEIAARALLMQRRNNVQVAVVDYLQLVQRNGGEDDRRREIDGHINTFKRLAKQTGLAVIVLSQMSRPTGGNSQENPVPSVMAFKESGGIHEAADLALMLHRPDFRKYEPCPMCAGRGSTCAECHGRGQISTDKTLHMIVAKNRFGEAGFSIELGWNGRLMEVTDTVGG